jgi:hypothetical protein
MKEWTQRDREVFIVKLSCNVTMENALGACCAGMGRTYGVVTSLVQRG